MKGFFEDTEDNFIEQVYKPVQKKQPKVFDNVRNIPDQIEFDEASGNLVVTPCQCKMDAESNGIFCDCLLYTSPSPRDRQKSRMPSSA